jgi:stearoyl-CoA desaturase (delta-9 desaturase)
MLHEIPALKHVGRLTGDLQADPLYRWLDRWFLLLQLPLGAALYWYGELAGVHGGGLGLVLWAIPLRLVLVYHVTWLVNSATHFCGYRNFDCPDLSRNCWWVAILSFGEGWHNNHHAFPHSARHGLRWFEFGRNGCARRAMCRETPTGHPAETRLRHRRQAWLAKESPVGHESLLRGPRAGTPPLP